MLFNHPEHVAHVLNQNACGIGDVVQVAFCEIRQAGTGHQVEVFNGRVEAFAQAGVEVEQWGVAVDEKHGVVGGGFGAGGETAGWKLLGYGKYPRI